MDDKQEFPAGRDMAQPIDPNEQAASMDTTLSYIATHLGSEDIFTGKDASLDTLIAALSDQMWQRRTEATRKLGEVKEQDSPKVVELLITRLQSDQVPMVRAAAARALSQHYPLVREEPLARALDDDDDDVRTAAAQALKTWGTKISPQTRNVLITAFLGEADEYARAAIITALGEAGSSVPLNIFEDALKDNSWIVREAATLAMGKQGIRADIDALSDLLNDSSESVCQAAAYASKRIAESIEKLRSEGISERKTNEEQVHSFPSSKIVYQPVSPLREEGEQRGFGTRSDWQLEPCDIRKHYPIVGQVFDDAYIDIPVLEALMKRRVSYSDIEPYLGISRRVEYMRSLLTSEKLIVNRTFLYNNPILFQDYLPGNPERQAFKHLVEQGTILPFLFNESGPLDISPWIRADTEGSTAWKQLCEEVKVPCLRLSWDDETNQDLIRRLLSFRFHQFAISAEERDVKKFAQYFGVPSGQIEALSSRLGELADASKGYFRNQGGRNHVNRTYLYEQFVTEGNPSLRQYDGQKPFAAVIKQLLDLSYNSNLADALSGHLLTPVGSPTRLILQEWDQIPRELPFVSASQLIEMLRRDTFQIIQGVLERSSLRSLALLSLSDVLLLREQESAWKDYIQAMQALLAYPLDFHQLAPTVVLAYDALMRQATSLLERRNFQKGIAPWKPGVEVEISVGGESVVTDWNEGGVITNAPQSSEDIAAMLRRMKVGNGGEALCSVRLTIKDGGHGQSRAMLATSFDVLRVKMKDARKQWEEVVRKLGEMLQSQEELKGAPTSTLDLQEQAL